MAPPDSLERADGVAPRGRFTVDKRVGIDYAGDFYPRWRGCLTSERSEREYSRPMDGSLPPEPSPLLCRGGDHFADRPFFLFCNVGRPLAGDRCGGRLSHGRCHHGGLVADPHHRGSSNRL